MGVVCPGFDFPKVGGYVKANGITAHREFYHGLSITRANGEPSCWGRSVCAYNVMEYTHTREMEYSSPHLKIHASIRAGK